MQMNFPASARNWAEGQLGQSASHTRDKPFRLRVESEAAKTIGWDDKFRLFKVVLDKVTNEAIAEIQPRWINRLARRRCLASRHVRIALIYRRWDDKE